MTTKQPQRPADPNRQPVRVAQMKQILQQLDVNMAMKTTSAIRTYHQRYLEPRLRWLEMPWYQKLWIMTLQAWSWLKAKVKRQKEIAGAPYEIGDHVMTTEIGKAHFDGKRQTGVVDALSGEAPMVGVRVDGDDEVTWYSFSVWEENNRQHSAETAELAKMVHTANNSGLEPGGSVAITCDCSWKRPHTRGAAGCDHPMGEGL